jgi:hypothetical protein
MASSDPHRGTCTIFYGPVINPVSLTRFSALPHCLLSIDSSGKIEWMIDNVYDHQLQETLASKSLSGASAIRLKDGEFLMPGFIDTHTVYAFFSDCKKFGLIIIILWYSMRLNFRSWERQSLSFHSHSFLKDLACIQR